MRIKRIIVGALLMGAVGMLSGCHHFWHHRGDYQSHYGYYHPYHGHHR